MKRGERVVAYNMVMPGEIGGREVVEKLRREKKSLRAIYSSGYSADVVGRNFELREGINFLQKPYPPTKLAEVVRTVLDA